MSLLNPSILSGLNTNPDALPAVQRGLQTAQGLMQYGQQQDQYKRQQAFMQTLDEVVKQAGDFTTPEGQKAIVQGLAQRGFGQEAQEIAAKLPQPKAPSYAKQESDNGTYLYNESNPRDVIPLQFNGENIKPKSPKPPEPKNPDSKIGKDGFYYNWNPAANRWDKTNLQAPEKDTKPDGPKSTDIFTQEQQLRNQYIGQTKNYRTIRDAYGTIQASAQDPSPAGDLSLIFSYMKILDPNSTVREGEFANAQNATGVPEQILNKYNQALKGERLNPSQRADFLGRAKMLYSKAEFQKKKTQDNYARLASKYPGLNPERVTMDDDLAVAPDASPQALPTHEQYDSLPSGAEYTDPKGNVRRKR